MSYPYKKKYARGVLMDSTRYYDYPEELGLGGVLGEAAMGAGSGALSGATIGAVGGPIGWGLGALIGGGTGFIKGLLGHRQEKQMEDLFEEQQNLAPEMAPVGAISQRTFNTGTPNIPTFAMGGMMDFPSVNKREEKETIDKMLTDLKGPLHSEGGIDVAGKEVEGGETLFKFKNTQGDIVKFVFSDKKIVPGSKLTFAEQSRKIRGPEESMRPEHDRISRRTKEKQLKDLMLLQEGSGENMESKEKLQMGGFYMPGIETTISGANALKNLNTLNSGTLMSASGTSGRQGFFSGLADSTKGLGTSLLYGLPGLLGAAGPLAQLRMAQRPAEQVDFERIPEAPAPQFVDPSQAVRSAREVYGGVKQGLKEYGRRPGQVMTGLVSTGAKEAGTVGDLIGRAQNINAQIANRRNELNQITRARNAMIGQSEDITNLASRGARESAYIDALTQLGNIGGGYFRDVGQRQAQNRQNELMTNLLENAFANLSYSGRGKFVLNG